MLENKLYYNRSRRGVDMSSFKENNSYKINKDAIVEANFIQLLKKLGKNAENKINKMDSSLKETLKEKLLNSLENEFKETANS